MVGINDESTSGPWRFTAVAVGFELLLGVIAAALGWLTGPWPWSTLEALGKQGTTSGLGWGAVAAIGLFAAFVLTDRYPIWIFGELKRTVRQTVLPLFRGTRAWHLLLISLAAGVGEELLFRGYFQAGLIQVLPMPGATWWALLATSVLFGLCHWISPAYALLATLMGTVLGLLMLLTGNLLAPIVAHGLYDFLALVYLMRQQS